MIKACLTAVAATLCLAAPALAQDAAYPAGPIRLITPFTPGGSTDVLCRITAGILVGHIGQPGVVVNMPGAGGTIGVTYVAHAKPDGYTLLCATPSMTINPFVQKNIPYDPIHDLEPVELLAESPTVLIVAANSPIKTVKDVIDTAKAKPDALNYGTAGIGSFDHMSTTMFAARAHITLTHVPYRGATQAVNDLIGGQMQLMFENITSIIGQVHGGQLRVLGVGTAKRFTLLPDAPAIDETVPGYESISWFGIAAPAKTPPAYIAKLNAALSAGLKDPAVRKQLETLVAEPVGGTPADFGSFLKKQYADMGAAAKAANIQAQ